MILPLLTESKYMDLFLSSEEYCIMKSLIEIKEVIYAVEIKYAYRISIKTPEGRQKHWPDKAIDKKVY